MAGLTLVAVPTTGLVMPLDNALPPGTYQWQVPFGTYLAVLVAEDNAGNQAISLPAAIAIERPNIPEPAPDVAVEDRGTALRVSWPALQGATLYQVWRAASAAGLNAAKRGDPTAALFYIDLLPAAGDATVTPALTYYYKVQALNLDGPGEVSPHWTGGTASGLNGDWVPFDSMEGNRIKVGTLDATKLAALLVITQTLKTALSGARWELEGHTGSGTQDQLRFLDSSGVLLMLLNATGLSFYGSASQGDFSLARNGSGRGQLTMGAMSVGTDGTGPFVSIPLTTTGGGGEVRFGGSSANARLREQDYGGLSAVGFTKLNGTIGDPALVLYDNVGGGSGSEKLALYWDGIGSDNAAISEYTFRHASGRWNSNIPITAGGLAAGADNGLGYLGNPFYTRLATDLGTTGGTFNPIGSWHYPSGTANMIMALHQYRGQNGSNSADARFWFHTFSYGVADGGGLQLGLRNASDPFFGLFTSTTPRLYWDHPNTRIEIPNGLHITGPLSKGSGSFVIPDPTPGRAGWELRHCFAEAPTRGENLYTYVASFGPRGGGLRVLDPEGQPLAGATIAPVDDGTPAKWAVTIPLPDYWPHLNEQPRAMAHNTGDGWGRCKARVGDDLTSLTLLAEEGGAYTIDLRGTRKDDVARAWWDRRGVRKTQAQRWTNEATAERRATSLAARGKRAGAGAPPTAVEPPTGAEFAAMMAAAERGEVREQRGEETIWL